MATRIYGASDDLIESDGDVSGELGSSATEDDEQGDLIICSDATLLEIKYGKEGRGIWQIKVLRKGSLFDRLEICDDDEADVYSDVAHFRDGLKWAYQAREWQIME